MFALAIDHDGFIGLKLARVISLTFLQSNLGNCSKVNAN